MNKIPEIFNRKKVKLHRERAGKHIGEHDFLIGEVADRLFERLNDLSGGFESTLNIGCGLGVLSEKLNSNLEVKMLVNQDFSEVMAKYCNGVVADEEKLPFAEKSFDLVVSNLVLHLVNDLPGTLLQIKKILKPDGLLLASMYGGNTLQELRQVMSEVEVAEFGGISPRVSPFADVKTLGSLIQRLGFDLPVVDSDVIKVVYDSVEDLMHDIRRMGEASALVKYGRPLNRGLIAKISKLYNEKFSDGERGIVVTFEVINITGLAARGNK